MFFKFKKMRFKIFNVNFLGGYFLILMSINEGN
jgi:hypothetical protein